MSRWQLERLQRELESLRERLADAGGQRGTEPQSGAPGATRLDEAIANLERATAPSAEQGGGDRREAEAEAFRQGAAALRTGADQLRQQDVAGLAESLRQAERETAELLAEHRRIGERLEDLQQELLRATRAGERRRFREYGLYDEAETKRRMQEALTRIAADIAELREEAERIPDAGAATARQLDRALDELAGSRIQERLGLAAEYFEMGSPLYVIAQEGRVESALEQFRERLDLAANRMESAQAGPARATTVDDIQRLRRQLADIGQGGPIGELAEVANAVRRLEWSLQDGTAPRDLEATRARYRGLGAAAANSERLYRMTLAELDRLEIEFGKVDGGNVRVAEPRDRGYESPAVARYFRALSCEDC